MTSHPSSGWRRTVGAQWSSVKRQQDASSPSSPHPMQQGMHSSLLVTLSRPDLDQDYQHQQQQELLLQQQQELQQLQQQQQYQQEQQALLLQQQQQQQSQQQQVVTSSYPGSMLDQTVAHNNTQSEHQRALQQFNENQKQQQLYLQQLQLMQRLQSMPGSTTRPWYPTFGPAITTSCSDSTILLDSPHQYRLINNAKLNRHAVGPHWRSIQTSSTYSPTPSPPSSSPQLQARTLAPSSSSLSTSSSSSSLSTMPCTTTALHAYLSSTYSSAASIDQARATSFHQHGHGHGMESNALPEGRQGTQDEPVHHQYYQSHSYPHDPRHHPHPAYHPGNSREARDSSPLANRASPLTPASERFADSSRKMKRKAAWQDQDNSNSNNNNENGDNDDEDEGGNERSNRNRQEENDSERRIKPSMMSSDSSQGFQPMSLSVGGPPRSESQTASQPYSIQSSVQQFIPITTSTASSHHFAPSRSNMVEQEQDQDQDQDMGSVDSFNVGANAASFPTPSSRPSPMSMETSSVDQEDMDVVLTSTESGVSKQSKRTKPRLNPNVFGTMSIAETLREQSGERIQDIFQECFYNAASSSTR